MQQNPVLSSMKNLKGHEKPLPEQVAEQIRQIIIDKQLKIGDRLPSEFELAEQISVGRGTIREAVKLLVARNVLEIRRGIGTYVADNTGFVEDPFGFAYMGEDAQLVQELFPIRLQMEPWIAELAAHSATAEQIAQLRVHQHRVEALIAAGENHLFEDQKLHTCIADCTGNRVLSKLVPVITYSIHTFGRMTNRTKRQETVVTHKAIIDAIERHDPAAARQAMIDHLMMNKKAIQALSGDARCKYD